MIKNSVRRNPAKNTSSSSSMAKTESGPSSDLPPPPPISLPAVVEMVGSSWDLIKSFAPAEDEEQEQEDVEVVDEEDMRARSVGSGWEVVMSKSGSSWDVVTSAASYSSASLRDMVFVSSPERGSNTRPRTIKSWTKGQVLGIGSFGTVYEAISDNDGCFFAVKEVSLLDHGNHDDAQLCILQLEHEIALLSQFEHDNIVQYYGTDREEDKLFIFLELVTQGSLVSLYQKYSLRDPQVSAYTRQILEGLNYVHDRNIVHRDVKCANILVHADGSVKLADFGLAKEMSKINMLKSCKGSVYWMAPEVVNPRKTYGPAADIWSLGCTVLEMLTRQIPHPNVEWQHAFFKIGRGEQPPIPNNLSWDARDFITQCVQVDPDDRPSASQLLYHPFVRNHLPYSSGLGTDYTSSSGTEVEFISC